MRHNRWMVGALIAALALVAPAAALAQQGPGAPGEDKGPGNDIAYEAGSGVCFVPNMRIGSITIAGGRCYNFYLVRNAIGTYLGLGAPGRPWVQPGQVVYLNTPGGNSLLNRFFALVPLTTNMNLRVGTVQYTPVRLNVVNRQANILITRGGESTVVGATER